MRIPLAAAALLLCAATLPAVGQDASPTAASQRFTAALGAGDAATAAGFFADDAVALPPGRGPVSGKAAIQQFLGGMTRSVKDLKYVSEEMAPINDATTREVGTFSFKLQKQDVTGKYLLIWTKSGGDWKIAADMWNRSGGNGGAGGRGGMGRKGQGGGNQGQP